MLYIASTPIGSIEESSLQLAKTLVSSDIILAEDTRSFHHLYQKIQELYHVRPLVEQKIISYYKDIEFAKLPEILDYLSNDKSITLVSEAGTPLVSDPGFLLVAEVRKQKIPITYIPGGTAFVAAGVLAGSSFKDFLFKGFLPKKPSDAKKELRDIAKFLSEHTDGSVALYESPHRINTCLGWIGEILPEISVTLCREINKMYEEVLVGKASDLVGREYKGEMSLILRNH